MAPKKKTESAESTADSASVAVGGARGTGDVAAAPNPNLPTVAGPDASPEEQAAAARSQGPSGRTEITGKTEITLRDGSSVTVSGDVERTRQKLSGRGIVSFVNGDSVVTVDAADVRQLVSV